MKRDQIKHELAALQKSAKGGILHASQVVEWAEKNRKSALHSQFEWDNSKAADEYRLWQARRLIVLNIVSEDSSPQVVSLRFDRPRGGGYRAMNDVVEREDLSRMMLEDAMADLRRVRDRYQLVKELTAVWAEVEKVEAKRLKKAA